ncbi:MAG: hypothetical protein WAN43_11775, partial [Rhodomicrobium sp.]
MDADNRIAELEETVKQRDARVSELTEERDKERALVAEMHEHVREVNDVLDRWIEAFNMELNDRGEYCWREPLMHRHDELRAKYLDLLKDWNK